MKEIKPIELGIAGDGTVLRNLSVPALVEKALARGEGCLLYTSDAADE